MKKRFMAILLSVFCSFSLMAGGLPTIDITAMLNWITKYATDVKNKTEEKIKWVQDIKTATEHFKQIEEYYNQLKGIDITKFTGAWNALEIVCKMQDKTKEIGNDIQDCADKIEYAVNDTFENTKEVEQGSFFADIEKEIMNLGLEI